HQQLGRAVGDVVHLQTDLDVVVDVVEERAVELAEIVVPHRLAHRRHHVAAGQQVARTPVVSQTERHRTALVDADQVVAAARQALQRQFDGDLRDHGRLGGNPDVDVGAAGAVHEGVVRL